MATEFCEDRARVDCEGTNPTGFAATIEFDSEKHICGFRLAVGLPPVIGAMLKIWIVEINSGSLVAARRERNDACAMGFAESRPQTCGQLKVAQMIRGKVRFISTSIAGQRDCHDARAIDEQVQRAAAGQKLVRKGVDGNWIEQVEAALFHPRDAFERLARFLWGACRDNHYGACFSKNAGRLQADAGISTGDYGDFASQIDPLERFAGSGSGAETGMDRYLFAWHL
jgi:hypothetical protein